MDGLLSMNLFVGDFSLFLSKSTDPPISLIKLTELTRTYRKGTAWVKGRFYIISQDIKTFNSAAMKHC